MEDINLLSYFTDFTDLCSNNNDDKSKLSKFSWLSNWVLFIKLLITQPLHLPQIYEISSPYLSEAVLKFYWSPWSDYQEMRTWFTLMIKIWFWDISRKIGLC